MNQAAFSYPKNKYIRKFDYCQSPPRPARFRFDAEAITSSKCCYFSPDSKINVNKNPCKMQIAKATQTQIMNSLLSHNGAFVLRADNHSIMMICLSAVFFAFFFIAFVSNTSLPPIFVNIREMCPLNLNSFCFIFIARWQDKQASEQASKQNRQITCETMRRRWCARFRITNERKEAKQKNRHVPFGIVNVRVLCELVILRHYFYFYFFYFYFYFWQIAKPWLISAQWNYHTFSIRMCDCFVYGLTFGAVAEIASTVRL